MVAEVDGADWCAKLPHTSSLSRFQASLPLKDSPSCLSTALPLANPGHLSSSQQQFPACSGVQVKAPQATHRLPAHSITTVSNQCSPGLQCTNRWRMEPHTSTAESHQAAPASRFQCQECHQTFGRVEHLTRHSRSHTKERSLKCSYCRKGFYRMYVRSCSVLRPTTRDSSFRFHLPRIRLCFVIFRVAVVAYSFVL